MPTVTVPGGPQGSPPLTYTFSSGAGLTVAQQIANALAAAGTLSVTSSTGSTVPPPSTTAGAVNELVLTGSTGTVTVPAGYAFVANNNSGPVTIQAAPGTSIITSVGGGLFTETGAATIAASGGANVISQSGAGAVALEGGDGSDTVIAGGTSGTISGGLGSNQLTIGGSGEAILAQGTDTISVSGANDTVFGGPGSLTFIGGANTTTVIGGAGPESLTAGAGGLLFQATTLSGSATTVNSGTGSVTIFGAPGASVNLTGSSGKDFLVAGSGNETLNAAGSSSSNWLSVSTTVTSSSVAMIGGSGSDTLISGSGGGSTTMTGGAGADAFVFFKQAAGGAKDVITDFDTSADSVYIEGYAAGSASALQNAATVGAGGVTLTLSDGTSVTFSNLTNVQSLNGKIQYG